MKKAFIGILILFLAFSLSIYAQEAKQKTLGQPKQEQQKSETKPTEEKKLDTKQTSTQQTQATQTKSKTKVKPIKGSVISLANLINTGNGQVKKEEAIKLAEQGSPIVFITGTGNKGKIYFVFNEDGSFAGRKLANFANNKFVGIIGKTKVVNGLNIIIASAIESMD